MQAPRVAIGDGALGFWATLRELWSQTREQSDWVHRLRNVLDQLPKRLAPKAKGALHEIMNAETREVDEGAKATFAANYEGAAGHLTWQARHKLLFSFESTSPSSVTSLWQVWQTPLPFSS